MGKTRRVGPGAYNYTTGGRRYAIREVRRGEGYPGKPLWNVSLMTGPGDHDYGPPFDSAETLADAKGWADVASHCRDGTAGESEANARLIAAAPDLLAACERAVALYELVISDHPDLDPDGELPPELDALRAAVARARGG